MQIKEVPTWQQTVQQAPDAPPLTFCPLSHPDLHPAGAQTTSSQRSTVYHHNQDQPIPCVLCINLTAREPILFFTVYNSGRAEQL